MAEFPAFSFSLFAPNEECVDWIREQLARVTYKEGWNFNVTDTALVITFRCQDTYNPGHTTTIGKMSPFYVIPTHDPDVFFRWLAEELKGIEVHESQEWLKVDGQLFDNPHKGIRFPIPTH